MTATIRWQMRALVGTIITASALAVAGVASAQGYPSKPVRLIVPFSPGGGADITARTMAKSLSESLGQPVIVENRTGGNSVIGTMAVARSAADGYTFLLTATIFLIVPSMTSSPQYDPLRDFSPVSLIGWVPQILVVHPSVRAVNVGELIALAKATAGGMNFATGGNGSSGHMACELFMRHAGLKLTHVPYKGDGPALVDLLGGQVSMKFDNMLTSLPHVKSGKLRALGITSPKRSSLLPEVPAINETLPGYEASIFWALFAPANTPRNAIARMHAEVAKFVNNPETKLAFAKQGADLAGSASPEEFGSQIATEHAKWTKVVQEAGIKME